MKIRRNMAFARRRLIEGLIMAGWVTVVSTLPALADHVLALAKASVAAAMVPPKTWNGPTSGPKATASQNIILVADASAPGAARFTTALNAAAAAIGWQVTLVNVAGPKDARRMALEHAIVDQPQGIIIFGFDPTSAAAAMKAGAAAGMKFVGVEVGARASALPALPFFAQLGPTPDLRASLAADAAVALSDGHAGAVILTDSRRRSDVHVARQIEVALRQCTACKVLAVVDVARDASTPFMMAEVKTLRDRYGSRWNVTLAPSDRYFRDFGAGLSKLGLKAPHWPAGIAAGEGSTSALKRIGAQTGQIATLARPLALEAWQAVDEMNRALAGKDDPSGFEMPPLLVASQNATDPVLATGSYDPALHYRHAFETIWAK